MKLKLLNRVSAVAFAAALANVAYADLDQERRDEEARLREREKCVAERTQKIKDTVEVVRIIGEVTGKGVDEHKLRATELKSYAPDNYVRECGESRWGAAIDKGFDPVNILWGMAGNIGRDLGSDFDPEVGRGFDEAVSPVTSYLARSFFGGMASTTTRDAMINSGQWDPLDYPGRGLVPELPDKALSQGIGSALDIAAFVGSLSTDEKVRLVTSVLPEFAPGRDLSGGMEGDTFGTTEDVVSGFFGGLASVAQLIVDGNGVMASNLPKNDPLYRESWGTKAARAGRDLDVQKGMSPSSLDVGHGVKQNLQSSAIITITIPAGMAPSVQTNTPSVNEESKISLSKADEEALDQVLHSALSSKMLPVSCETKGTLTRVASVELCEANGGLVKPASEQRAFRGSTQAGLVSCQRGDELVQVPSVDTCEGSGGAVVAVK